MGAAQLHPSTEGVRRHFGESRILMDPKVARLLPTSLAPTHIYTFFHVLNQHKPPGIGAGPSQTRQTQTCPKEGAALPSDLHIYLRPLPLSILPFGPHNTPTA